MILSPQNFKQVMEARFSETQAYSQWCYENTASILSEKFKDAALWIMCPAQMLKNVFSCYKQFVSSSIIGVPHYKGSYGGLPNLQHLFLKALELVYPMNTLDGRLPLEVICSLPIVLCGFSKGCVVLNQFLYEMAYFETGQDFTCPGDLEFSDDVCSPPSLFVRDQGDESTIRAVKTFMEKVVDIFWLDSGHSGKVGSWLVNRILLENLAKSNIKIHVHVTPYEVLCPNRPWIGEEERSFVDILKELNANIVEHLHFKDQESSLYNHFRVLEEF